MIRSENINGPECSQSLIVKICLTTYCSSLLFFFPTPIFSWILFAYWNKERAGFTQKQDEEPALTPNQQPLLLRGILYIPIQYFLFRI
jgi:hypothetical protein